MKKSKTGRKEKNQTVQEPTGITLDETDHDTTLTAYSEVKHIAALADIAKRLEDRVKVVQEEAMKG